LRRGNSAADLKDPEIRGLQQGTRRVKKQNGHPHVTFHLGAMSATPIDAPCQAYVGFIATGLLIDGAGTGEEAAWSEQPFVEQAACATGPVLTNFDYLFAALAVIFRRSMQRRPFVRAVERIPQCNFRKSR
jgi:hypothetical protein